MQKLLVSFFLSLVSLPAFADTLDDALVRTANACLGIAAEFDSMKTMAGINTAITGVGTLAGGGAIATGFVKQSTDAAATRVEIRLEQLRQIESARNEPSAITLQQIEQFELGLDNYVDAALREIATAQDELDRLTKQSKSLGNWRTGLMAGGAATNIAGAIIAGNNRAKADLTGAIADCKSAVADLRPIYMQARLDRVDAVRLADAENIITECGKWDTVNLAPIDNRGRNAMISSIAGAGLGTAGTITSAVANSADTRAGDTRRERNLNTASNALAIGTTAASATATIFNATQISAINRASDVANGCEGALR